MGVAWEGGACRVAEATLSFVVGRPLATGGADGMALDGGAAVRASRPSGRPEVRGPATFQKRWLSCSGCVGWATGWVRNQPRPSWR